MLRVATAPVCGGHSECMDHKKTLRRVAGQGQGAGVSAVGWLRSDSGVAVVRSGRYPGVGAGIWREDILIPTIYDKWGLMNGP